MNLNRGAWRTMENEWGDWINAGYRVKPSLDIELAGGRRPDTLRATYDVIDPRTGETVYRNEFEFVNGPGESFVRIPRTNIREMADGTF